MIGKLWKLKGLFILLVLFVAFAACVKEKDPNLERDQIRDAMGDVTRAINSGDLALLNKYFVQPAPEGAGPNRLMALLTERSDSVFAMHNRRFSIDKKSATVSFTLTNDPTDSNFSFLYLIDDKGWKIKSFKIN